MMIYVCSSLTTGTTSRAWEGHFVVISSYSKVTVAIGSCTLVICFIARDREVRSSVSEKGL